ncbi:DnaD domain protein [Mariniplasma anaerobium]|uniref:Replication initiation and membrane attachment protein n=1 Tax=Mariniplasma anaerobium TaxID=2735436 RepID=A0A7U9TGE0_9MOLU|nr:DnaD domain protein [Mariniplasma anaerobium]BCR35599.1 replication initiation and membrane attachment protein [Mariniplasma anaerobium]
MKNSSTFQLSVHSDLANQDFKVLALLYQPLLGVASHSLFVTFYQLNDKINQKSYTHQQLFDLLNLKQTEFLKMRNKLEALNLLEVYQENDAYIYVMKTPLSAKQFLLDTVFGSYLQSEIGEKNVDMLANLFKIETPKLEGYTNITKPFDSMYEFKSLNLLKLDYEFQGRKQNGGSHIGNHFDFNAFVEALPERLKNSQLLNQKLQQQISKIAFVYQFDVKDMVEVYIHASQSRQTINFQALNHKAKLHYESKNQTLEIKEKDIPKTDLIKNIPPQVIIQKYSKTDTQGIALSTATLLIERNHVDPGIINVILMLVLKQKDGVLPGLKYMETVLHDWLNRGIQTTEDALNHSTQLENQWVNKKKAKKISEPDWMDDYVKELEKMEA